MYSKAVVFLWGIMIILAVTRTDTHTFHTEKLTEGHHQGPVERVHNIVGGLVVQ
jgi:hypothetical protein